MKRNTIKWRIFKYNLLTIILLIALTTIVFNLVIRIYIERDTYFQMDKIASRVEDTALHNGPDLFGKDGMLPPPPWMKKDMLIDDPFKFKLSDADNALLFYSMLDHSLREPLSFLNAEYILLDSNKKTITPSTDFITGNNSKIDKIAIATLQNSAQSSKNGTLRFNVAGTDYIAVVRPVYNKNTFGLGWIIIYSSLQKVNQLQWGINGILLAILAVAALITSIFSSVTAKTISEPFSSLNEHIGAIAERKFSTQIQMPVDDELQEFVRNINQMSEKLKTYDMAQKTFLQNASHEFRTPLMSIQSYAEGIRYDVVDPKNAAEIILEETKRMTHLVEDLLYLSRLDAIEENYCVSPLFLSDFINSCAERMGGIAIQSSITLEKEIPTEPTRIQADEEKLSRAITNILSNSIRYARSFVRIAAEIKGTSVILRITDDGPGIDPADLPNIFERFYKGFKGNYGLGLAISRNVIEKHGGSIAAENTDTGALFTVKLPLYIQQSP